MSISQPSMPSKNRRTQRNTNPWPTFVIHTNFAAHLYGKCADVLAYAIHLDMNPEVKMDLKQSLASLGLWGYGLQDGHLDEVISESSDIGYAVVHFLNSLASLLTRDVVPFLTENVNSVKSSATRKLAADLDHLSKIAECHLKAFNNDESEDSDSDSDDEDCMDLDTESAPSHKQMPSTTASKIRFYISRLMDLLPAIEAVLEVQHTQRENSKSGSLGKHLEQHDRVDPAMFEQRKQRREKLRPLILNIHQSRNEDKENQLESVSRPKILPSASFPCDRSFDKGKSLGSRNISLRSGPEFTSPTWPNAPFPIDLPLLFNNTTRMVARARSDSCLKTETMNEGISPRLMVASSP